jgi:2-polyprenyl-6-methoxyphenol hydroxylase-like FAD-dependent oxidoreductase
LIGSSPVHLERYQHIKETEIANSTPRHGYPVVFFDRRMLIAILYEKIKDKSKVITSERVQTVENGTSGVTVTTTSGQTYTGSILIGADGVHSKVRQEMWKAAQTVDPTWIDPSEESGMKKLNSTAER